MKSYHSSKPSSDFHSILNKSKLLALDKQGLPDLIPACISDSFSQSTPLFLIHSIPSCRNSSSSDLYVVLSTIWGLPRCSVVKNPSTNAGDTEDSDSSLWSNATFLKSFYLSSLFKMHNYLPFCSVFLQSTYHYLTCQNLFSCLFSSFSYRT